METEQRNGSAETSPKPEAPKPTYSPRDIFIEELAKVGLSKVCEMAWEHGSALDKERTSDNPEIVGLLDEDQFRMFCRHLALMSAADNLETEAKKKKELGLAIRTVVMASILERFEPNECIVPLLTTGQLAKCKHEHDSEEEAPELKIAALKMPKGIADLFRSLAERAKAESEGE